MANDVSFRLGTADDSRTCFAIMRGALQGMLQRAGLLAPDAPQPPFEERWLRAVGLFGHLAATCSQWWIAEDRDGAAVGYARSTERDATVELTEFFVLSHARGSGVGRGLLERSFAPAAATRRFVIATTEPAAVALYLRFGVSHQTTAIDLAATPRAVELPAGYEAVPATLEDVLAIEREVLDHGRPQEVAFMLGDRPATLLRRDGRAVAYAFGPNAYDQCGPVAALDPADLPAALAQLETAAHAAGVERLELAVPLTAGKAVTWLLAERGFRVDPLLSLFLADGPWAKLDRYLPFNPCLFL
ncbi:MAG TPA: GNAT family N-acetyltransferase [Solirubrobacteraceae bacterium]|jgi:GNAT superfamily N-acetyltransferase|nr:GNAT family N-acetyltransferase [Solirubrobacteraceae bacterium]